MWNRYFLPYLNSLKGVANKAIVLQLIQLAFPEFMPWWTAFFLSGVQWELAVRAIKNAISTYARAMEDAENQKP
jgi:hypothetical protein